MTWRWHGSEDTTLAATARHEQRRSDAFESEGKADSLSISGSTLVGGTLALDGSLGFRTYDYEADTTFVIAAPAATEIPGHVETEGAQTTLGAGASWEASDALRPRLWTSVAIGTGDASYDYGAIDLDVPYRLTEVWEVGTNVSWVLFDGEEQLDGRDYDAGILVLYARVSF